MYWTTPLSRSPAKPAQPHVAGDLTAVAPCLNGGSFRSHGPWGLAFKAGSVHATLQDPQEGKVLLKEDTVCKVYYYLGDEKRTWEPEYVKASGWSWPWPPASTCMSTRAGPEARLVPNLPFTCGCVASHRTSFCAWCRSIVPRMGIPRVRPFATTTACCRRKAGIPSATAADERVCGPIPS